ncbi:vitamin K epoxide reductase [Candidatus Saccharibacteria bacterium]|nr:MAG: vitamin K epoxide reductase [Candidatus Saccharibacteria bacterium]
MSKFSARERVIVFAVLLAGSVLGLLASFVLSVEALVLAEDQSAVLSCSINEALNCATVANHNTASLLGFPNSFLGMVTMPVVATIAVIGMIGYKFPRWFMRALWLGVIAGTVFALWMLYQSFVVIGVFCPWCLTLDVAMLAILWAVFHYNALHNHLCVGQAAAKRAAENSYDAAVVIALGVALFALIIVKYGQIAG